MSPETSKYLGLVKVALEQHDERELFAAVAQFIDNEPLDAAVLLWAQFSSEDDVYFRRVIAYALAKTAINQSRYLWGPLASFIVSPYTDDDSTLINVLSALQLFHEYDHVLSAVIAPEFGAFALHCIGSSLLIVNTFCELIPHLNDRGVLVKLLSKSQARVARERLHRFDTGNGNVDVSETLAILRESNFAPILPDATPLLNNEDELLVREPPRALNDSNVSLLRSVLASTRSTYALRKQAEDVDGVVQQIKLTNSQLASGRLAVEIFERLVRTWRSALRELAQARQPRSAPSIKTYMLASAQGSFVMRFLTEAAQTDTLLQSLEEISDLAENPESLVVRPDLNPEARSNIVQFLDTLAQNNLDATVGVLDPYGFERPRRRILSSQIRPVIARIRELAEESSVQRQFSGTLEGASHRQGTFEALADDGEYIKGDVPSARRSILLQKMIGRRYAFAVEEHLTVSGIDEEKRQRVLNSISLLDDEKDTFTSAKSTEELKGLSTSDVPQQDRLDRIVDVVRLVASDKEVQPKALGMVDTASSRRHIDYMRQAAKILGLLNGDGTLTTAGWTLARLPQTRVVDFLSLQFEMTAVGLLWKKWAGVDDLHHLDEKSAVEFLRHSGLSDSMALRRGRTLGKWLIAFKSSGTA